MQRSQAAGKYKQKQIGSGSQTVPRPIRCFSWISVKQNEDMPVTHKTHSTRQMLPTEERGRFWRHFLTSDVIFTGLLPTRFPSQKHKCRPRTFWCPCFWLWWPVGSEQLQQRSRCDECRSRKQKKLFQIKLCCVHLL